MPCLGMVIGEAPGAAEDALGRPFVGPSGKLLDLALSYAGSSREAVYITNAYKLRPENNRNPTTEELAEHWPYLVDEFTAVSPLVIMTLGNVPLHFLTNDKGGITRRAGMEETVMNTNGEPITLIPNFHPAFVLRSKSYEDWFFANTVIFIDKMKGLQVA